MNYGEEEKYYLSDKDREIYLEGLKKYQDRGVVILIDGKKSSYEDLSKILEVHEDGFYMGDYVSDEQSGILTEIRFDRINTKHKN